MAFSDLSYEAQPNAPTKQASFGFATPVFKQTSDLIFRHAVARVVNQEPNLVVTSGEIDRYGVAVAISLRLDLRAPFRGVDHIRAAIHRDVDQKRRAHVS
jgi:hypothetical protein